MNQDSFRIFQNISCDCYPCHDMKDFSTCIFCFCPLYLIDECGGDYIYNKKGRKDCSICTIPHGPDGWDIVIKKLKEKVFNK